MSANTSRIAIILAGFLLIAGCGGGGSNNSASTTVAPVVTSPPEPETFTYSVPENIGDGWETADISAEGFDVDAITTMMNLVVSEQFPEIDSVAIVRNNKLLLYWHSDRRLTRYDGWINNTDNERHILHSTSKSFTSALVGIAIDQGYIADVQVPFYDLFAYASYFNPHPWKDTVTLEDALTMRFGYEWDEWSHPYTSNLNDLVILNNGYFDWAKALLDLQMESEPGTAFTYNTAGTTAIGQAVENAVGMPLDEFANVNLFYPMQITDAQWARTPSNLPIGGSGLFLKTRDLIKFGQLYLDNGVWQGQQLISAEWVADSVYRSVDLSSWSTFSEAYGYQWWLGDFDYNGQAVESWVTSGFGGQYIFVVPSLDLVVAFTGHSYNSNSGIANLYTIMRSHILTSID